MLGCVFNVYGLAKHKPWAFCDFRVIGTVMEEYEKENYTNIENRVHAAA